MPLERLQCPSCGASVTTGGHDSFFCNYCGVKLRVKVGSSGNAMAVLDAIKEDTGLLAKRAAYQHLVEDLQTRRLELSRIDEAWMAQRREAGGCTGLLHYKASRNAVVAAILVLLGILVLPLGGGERLGILLLAGIVMATWITWQWQRELSSALERYEASHRRCQGEINVLEDDVSALRAEIDKMIRRS